MTLETVLIVILVTLAAAAAIMLALSTRRVRAGARRRIPAADQPRTVAVLALRRTATLASPHAPRAPSPSDADALPADYCAPGDALFSRPALLPKPPLFELRGVSKAYRDPGGARVPVLCDVEFAIAEGITGVLGPSGQGKTTLLSLLGGLDTPDSGEICFRGVRLPSAEGPQLQCYRASRISFVFQELNLVTHLNVLENAALPLLLHGVPWTAACRAAHPFVEAVGLERLVHRRPAQLSGGERQRIAIARAFTVGGEVVLADEPTGSLDPVTASRVMRVFCDLSRRWRRSIVLVSHNEELVGRHCDRIVRCTPTGLVDVTTEFCTARLANSPVALSAD